MKMQWPYAAKIAFAIRDDDVSFFTSTEKLEKIYRNVWNEGFKVSFAAIPMHKATNNLNVPPRFRNTSKYYPIHQNKRLIEYLKSNISEGKADIVQHGFCHTENPNLPALNFDLEKSALSASNEKNVDLAKFSEFYGLTEEECQERIKKGRDILEQSFNRKIKVFVAPQEYLSKNLWKTLDREGLYYCGGTNTHAVPIRNISLLALLQDALRRLLRKRDYPQGICDISDLPHLTPTYKHYWNKYVNDRLSNYWFNQFKEEFQACLRKKGVFILVTHYWEYFYDWQNEVTQIKQLEYLNEIFNYVNKYNVWKCTITELFEWIFERDV